MAVTSDPARGSVAVDPLTGEITHTPDPGYLGSDTFTYEMCDMAGVYASAGVTVTTLMPDTATLALPGDKPNKAGAVAPLIVLGAGVCCLVALAFSARLAIPLRAQGSAAEPDARRWR